MTTTPIEVDLLVNGEPRRATVEARRTLADFLREDLGLTGTHVGASTACAEPAPCWSTVSRPAPA